MAKNNLFEDDDYLAKLLAEDAKKSSMRYSTMGLSALIPKRSIHTAPKPNTRFLSHIVREVDSHNTALKKKEELEARMRLRRLQNGNRLSPAKESGTEMREHKRRRLSPVSDQQQHDRERKRRRMSPSTPHSRSTTDETAHHKRYQRDRAESKNRSYRDEKHPSKPRHESKQRHLHSRNPAQTHGSRSGISERRHNETQEKRLSRVRSPSIDPDSDPLEDIVGPLPARKAESIVQPRGRGSYKQSYGSAIDSHFSSEYNPSQDVNLDVDSTSEQEDWDMALEALRDRAMWKQKQGQRLREAGWSDHDIQKWEQSNGNEKDRDMAIAGVRWSKKGEIREWDAGKSVQT